MNHPTHTYDSDFMCRLHCQRKCSLLSLCENIWNDEILLSENSEKINCIALISTQDFTASKAAISPSLCNLCVSGCVLCVNVFPRKLISFLLSAVYLALAACVLICQAFRHISMLSMHQHIFSLIVRSFVEVKRLIKMKSKSMILSYK